MKRYGWTPRFEALAGEYEGLTPGRILSQEKGMYRLVTDRGETAAEVSGRFRHLAKQSADYPAVGDFVMADIGDAGSPAIIRHVLPRKSCFTRKAAGERQEQVVAANIDTAFLCMSLNQNFSLRRLERYLSIAWDSGATPVVVLTKADLCEDIEEKRAQAEGTAVGADVLVTSALEEDGIAKIRPYAAPGRTVAFIGSSGVGKSTLINCLIGRERLPTGEISGGDRGRHTTTRRELILLEGGGMVIDTPGMRELGMWDSEAGIERTFSKITELAAQCRFTDCSHCGEPGCAVARTLEDGTLDAQQVASYFKLKAESAYAADSESYLAAKRQKFIGISKTNKANRRR